MPVVKVSKAIVVSYLFSVATVPFESVDLSAGSARNDDHVRPFLYTGAAYLFRQPVFDVLSVQQDHTFIFFAGNEQTEKRLTIMDQQTKDELLKLFESKLNQAMRFYLETCSRCGICTQACHVHESMPQVKYIAAYRAEIVRRIYKKYFKKQGKLWPSLGESKELTDMALEELYEAAYSCTGCRRCMVFCPHGIDTQMIMSIAKLLLVGANTEPEILTLLADTSVEKGKSFELFKESFMAGVKRLEGEVVKKWKLEAGELQRFTPGISGKAKSSWTNHCSKIPSPITIPVRSPEMQGLWMNPATS